MSQKQIKIVQEDGRSFFDMPNDPKENPCSDCGLCCSHFRIGFYAGEVEGGLGGFVPSEKVIKFNDVRAVMKGTENGGRCIALTGEIGKNVGCSIYHNRPTPCREFPVWEENGRANAKCNELRQKHGLPTILDKK
jgi:uncharacterized protein